MVNSTEVCISEEEAALYDRQLRLWGVEAQNRLKRSRILLLGMTPLAAELAKNLVLVGIQSLTVVDDVLTSEEDASCNFLIPREAVGKPRSTSALSRIQALNPMVRVSALSADCNNPIPEGHTYDVVILTSSCLESDIANWIAIKNNLRKSTEQVPGAHLVLASAMAFFGVAFLDLGSHEFMAEEVLPKKRPAPSAIGPKKSQAAPGTESTFVKKVARYSDLQDCLDITWSSTSTCPSLSPKSIPKGFLLLEVLRRCTIADLPLNVEFLKSVWTSVSAALGVDSGFLSDEEFACCCGAPSPSVNAVLGGVVAQEIVRAITGKGAPYGNWYFFNGLQCSMTVEWLPKEDICPTTISV
ncbi:hypothetical protein CRM22_005582 [Opisthorchis felineus]|uniref:SUMO-activating enzyme subunit 1 n=1 Tax=Opisthorchis felineus TaxID=147828 RepID=A0A4S2LWD2_OPIFE|nr:hypothetical protein CRM22_005582 [Opisthorchis felineus]